MEHDKSGWDAINRSATATLTGKLSLESVVLAC